MDPTALYTFLFRAPPEVRTVELLGSWDNFTRPYYMHHDRRRGRGFWSGCFNFKNIIFDGDGADWTKPRSGGLKQGGTYWYFYRLNDAVEAFDDFQTYTKGCPLLPGQTVNVMDVPVEVEEIPSRRRSATLNDTGNLADLHRTHTLDPDDKWAALDPPPVSRVHERCISDLALNGRLETKPHSYRGAPTRPPPPPPVSAGPRSHLVVSRPGSAGDAYSLRSDRGRNSAPPSRGNSSIFEAYEQGAERRSLSAFPLPDVYRRDERPTTRSGGSSRHGFDFAFDDSASRPHSMSRTGDDDLDGTSFILEPAYSPPHSAYGSVDWRFTVTPADYPPTLAHPENEAPAEEYRRHQLGTSEPESLHRQSEDSNVDADAPAFDLCSPTFSAATISSNGGLNTPFRLSAGFTPSSAPTSANHAHMGQGDQGHGTSMDHITERLRQLGSEDSAGSLPSQVSSEDVGERPFVGHYALPIHGTGAESMTTLGKVSSGHASIAQQEYPPLPTPFAQQQNHEASFADSIFDELGYLGSSIA